MDCGISFSQLKKCLAILEYFAKRNQEYLNIAKVADALHLSKKIADELIDLLLQFQKFYRACFPNKHLRKVRKEGEWYLTFSTHTQDANLIEIQFSLEESKLIGDIIYYYQHIIKGKGFDVRFTTTDLLKKIRELNKNHPYFFERHGNGLLYPSSLALSLGNMLEAYNRANKDISCFIFENYKICLT